MSTTTKLLGWFFSTLRPWSSIHWRTLAFLSSSSAPSFTLSLLYVVLKLAFLPSNTRLMSALISRLRFVIRKGNLKKSSALLTFSGCKVSCITLVSSCHAVKRCASRAKSGSVISLSLLSYRCPSAINPLFSCFFTSFIASLSDNIIIYKLVPFLGHFDVLAALLCFQSQKSQRVAKV